MEDTARQHYIIGDNLRHKGFYEDSLEEFEKSLNIRVSLLEETDMELGKTYYSIGLTKKALKDYVGAFYHLYKALHIFEIQPKEEKEKEDKENGDKNSTTTKTYSPPSSKRLSSSSTTTSTNELITIQQWIIHTKLNLARTHHSQGLDYQLVSEFDKSIIEHRKALGIRELYLGVNHLETARTYYVLGCALSDKGLYDEALCELRRALRTRYIVFGKEHLDTIEVLENMIIVLHAKGCYTKTAILDYKESLLHSIAMELEGDKLLEQCNGQYVSTEHPEIANWAETAMVQFRKALSLEEQCLGELGPTTCDLHLKVAKSLGLLNCLEESLEEYKASICVFERLLGKFHYTMGQIYIDLADLLSERDEYETSLCFYCKAYGILDSTVGQHEDTTRALQKVRNAATLLDEHNNKNNNDDEDDDDEEEEEDDNDGEEEDDEEEEETEEKETETVSDTTMKESSSPSVSNDKTPSSSNKDESGSDENDKEETDSPAVVAPGGYTVDWN